MCPLRTFLKKIPSIIHFMHKNIVGSRVRKARKESKVTQMELAARLQVLGLNIERPAISKLESGNRPVTDVEVAALAQALKVPISWLFEEE
jgi:transcriptional regulator with XRE-family HTH domain